MNLTQYLLTLSGEQLRRLCWLAKLSASGNKHAMAANLADNVEKWLPRIDDEGEATARPRRRGPRGPADLLGAAKTLQEEAARVGKDILPRIAKRSPFVDLLAPDITYPGRKE